MKKDKKFERALVRYEKQEMIKKNIFKPTVVDRIINYFTPERGLKRLRARAFMSMVGGYIGASKNRRSMKEWTTYTSDADTDILPDLITLRNRSRDLIRNNPLAAGAIKTKVTNVIGTGLKLQAAVDQSILVDAFKLMSESQVEAWEARVEREWRLYWESHECDVTRTLNGYALTQLVYRQVKENGDVFILLPRVKRPPFPYDLRLQVIEADRVANRGYQSNTATLAGGVETDKYGAPIYYHIRRTHPGNIWDLTAEWDKVPAFGKTLGLRNVIHLYEPTRPGQRRGVPDLAPVIEPLRQLGNYTDAELTAAVISGMYTVFIESNAGDGALDLSALEDETGTSGSDDEDYKLSPGLIVGLKPGEKVHDSNPGRPNTAFDPFVTSILRQIGVALELPYEILIKHFTASYSAARAALLEAWKYFKAERKWLADNFLQIIYEIWMVEAISKGRIKAPGFFSDPIIRKAYTGASWIGPAKGQIDELKEVKAARERNEMGVSSLTEITSEMTGQDWEAVHRQIVKENNARREDGLILGTGNLVEGEKK